MVGEVNYWHHVGDQQQDMRQDARRPPFLRLLQQIAIVKREVAPVPSGLQREEGSVKPHGHDCDEGALTAG